MRWFSVIIFSLLLLTTFEVWRLQNIAKPRTDEALLRFLLLIIPNSILSYLHPETQAGPESHDYEDSHDHRQSAPTDISNGSEPLQSKDYVTHHTFSYLLFSNNLKPL